MRLNIDDLRKEKMSHREQLMRMKAKAEKMDTDIAFLTHQAHAALDQREKVRGKFLMAQRDMMQEREQKLAVIAELVTRANALDDDWAERQTQIADTEEQRRRRSYGSGRERREMYESAEVRLGFLTAQSRGWESEFERLQAFTGMETKFDPREKEGKQVVEEITSRCATRTLPTFTDGLKRKLCADMAAFLGQVCREGESKHVTAALPQRTAG